MISKLVNFIFVIAVCFLTTTVIMAIVGGLITLVWAVLYG